MDFKLELLCYEYDLNPIQEYRDKILLFLLEEYDFDVNSLKVANFILKEKDGGNKLIKIITNMDE